MLGEELFLPDEWKIWLECSIRYPTRKTVVLFVVKCEQTLPLHWSRSLLNTIELVEGFWIGRILVDRDNTILTEPNLQAAFMR